MKYRAEIDGLRAIAVISVVLFHAGFEHFSGGFVGVDIFFVISGYLITTIILSEKEQGIFSLANFYERRARRILPALFFVILISLPFAWLWLIPSDMKDFSQSLVAVSSFSSNILFWRETGYWGATNELKPLLHTWSLAVEEQYYILFPLFLMLMWRFHKRWILSSFIVIAASSLFISEWGAYNKPSANFFLLPTRGWEIAIGACIAFYFLYRKKTIHAILSHRFVDEALCVVGLLMIGYAVFVFDESTPFPSFYALMPTVGTGLIILFSSAETLVGRLLSTKLLVGIGLISYSAYLWHQPLIAFSHHATSTEPSQLILATMATISFPLAYLSWRFIEKPFRNKGTFGRKEIFTYSVIGSVIFIVTGLAGIATDGFDGRYTQSRFTLNYIEQKLKVNHGLSETCAGKFTLSPDCRTSDQPEILIWGDSFAMHLAQGITASNPKVKVIQMTKSNCGPFFDVAPVYGSKYSVSWAKGCLEFTEKVREWLKKNTSVKYAVLSSPFSGYISKKSKLMSRNGDLSPANILLAAKEFKKTLNELMEMGIRPIIFSPPPANGVNLGRCLAKTDWKGLNLNLCDFGVDEIINDRIIANQFLNIIKNTSTVIQLDELTCDTSLCKTHFDSIYIFRDDGHLSCEGSAAIGKKYNFYKMITDGK
ncbi:MAG: acyltransferase family protein [Candidatus Electronema sp. VV]